MYGSFGNQSLNLLKYFSAVIIMFYFLPKHIFKQSGEAHIDNVAANFIKMVFLVIISVYSLAFARIYELVSVAAIIIYLWLHRVIAKNNLKHFRDISPLLQVWLYDYADGENGKDSIFIALLKKVENSLINGVSKLYNIKNYLLRIITFTLTFGYIVFIRFYDAVVNAAPAMSDAYVTLAWMKYISQNRLFYDGIYPHGFHIFLSFLNKVSMTDAIYVLKYAGPFNSVLIALGLFFVIYRTSGRFVTGLLAALIYSSMGNILLNGIERQVATNSQEFAFIFIFPTLYFVYRYITEHKGYHFFTAFAGMAIIGLTHSMAFAFMGIGIFSLIIAAMLVDIRAFFVSCVEVVLAVFFVVVISFIPIGLGLLMGKGFHLASAEFLTRVINEIRIPVLTPIDYIALSATFIMTFSAALARDKKSRLWDSYTVLLLVISFCIYYFGGIITKNTLIATRSEELWKLVVPIIIPSVLNVIFSNSIKKEKAIVFREYVIFTVIFTTVILFVGTKPIIPYKMEYNENVEQYLRISSTLRPTEWMIISQEEGYPLIMGNGFHMLLREFINSYNPIARRLATYKNGRRQELKTKDIFIFHEKNVFDAGFESMKERVKEKKEDNTRLLSWVEKYKETHENMSIYFENDNITVYHIHQPDLEKNEHRKIWEDYKD